VTLGANRRVCFFGDSQMRHLFNNFILFTADYGVRPVESATKAVMPSAVHTYVEKVWTGFDAERTEELVLNRSCTDAVVNVGQWPAGWPEGYPWPFEMYESNVRSDMEFMRTVLSDRLGLRVYWISTNPTGYMDVHGRSLFGPDALDWRHDAVIDKYNRLALHQAQDVGGVEFIDMGPIVRPLGDLPYDGAHYAGIVGDAMARELVAILTGR
jgi:hypothetical protein